MGYKRKKDLKTDADIVTYYLKKHHDRELPGQSKWKHLRETRHKIIECDVCKGNEKLERHRINPDGEYEDSNIIILCLPCHDVVHDILKEIGWSVMNFGIAIELTRMKFKENTRGI